MGRLARRPPRDVTSMGEPIHGVNAGDTVEIRALHANGEAYRWWTCLVESVAEREVVVVWPRGTRFAAPTPSSEKTGQYPSRGFYWLNRPYALVEHYKPTGEFAGIDADICSPARIEGRRIIYTDYELDVIKRPRQPAYVEDEDEFLHAAGVYGYTPEFQEQCRRTVEDVRRILESWAPGGLPLGFG